MTPDDLDDTLRHILASILGDVAHFPSVTPGHAVGALSATDAALFARRCEQLVAGDHGQSLDDQGVLRLRFDDAA